MALPKEGIQHIDETVHVRLHKIRTVPRIADAAAASGARSPLTRPSFEPIKPTDERLVCLCCRIHPLIRDSSSIQSVPFHIEWVRDMTRNCTKTKRFVAAMTVPVSCVLLSGAFAFDVSRLIRRDMSQPFQTDAPAPMPSTGGDTSVDVGNTLSAIFMVAMCVRLMIAPILAISAKLLHRALGNVLKGGFSWQHLHLNGGYQQEIATSMLAIEGLNGAQSADSGQPQVNPNGPNGTKEEEFGSDITEGTNNGAVKNFVLEMLYSGTSSIVLTAKNRLKAAAKKVLGLQDIPEDSRNNISAGKAEYANRESNEGHWCQDPVNMKMPIASGLPATGEYDEQMSLGRVLFQCQCGQEEGVGETTENCAAHRHDCHVVNDQLREKIARVWTKIWSQYNTFSKSGDLRIAIDEIRSDKNFEAMDQWLTEWRNCWEEPSDGSKDLSKMKRMLDACKKEHPSRWGPAKTKLELPIWVLNRDGEGVLVFSEHLLSTILPRYGHKTTVEEVAYLSAKGWCSDKRYYRPIAYYFWAASAVVLRTTIALASSIGDIRVLAAISFGVVTLWLGMAKNAFDLDAVAIVTGRKKEGCILASAGGSKVTAAILAKWNANISKESLDFLTSFHTEAAGAPGNRAMDFDTFQRAGGLMIDSDDSTLAILPGLKDLKIRRVTLNDDNMYHIGGRALKAAQYKAKDIVSHSTCLVGMRMPPDMPQPSHQSWKPRNDQGPTQKDPTIESGPHQVINPGPQDLTIRVRIDISPEEHEDD